MIDLERYVGISRNSCDCYGDFAPEGELLTDSLSGVYVDEEPNFNFCRYNGWSDFWQILVRMRREAVTTLQTDLSAGWYSKLRTRAEASDSIGQPSYSNVLTNATAPYGLVIKTDSLAGPGTLVEDSFRTLIIPSVAIIGQVVGGGTVDVTLTVTNLTTWQAFGEPIVLTGIGSYQTVRRPLEEPIVLRCDGSDYQIQYTTSAPFKPANNAYHCSCGDKLKGLAGFIHLNVSEAQGLSLLAKAKCNPDALLQEQISNDAFGRVLAVMIRAKTLENLLVWVKAQPEVNRYTILDGDGLENRIGYYQKVYQDRIDWLMTQTPVTDGFCLSCTTNMRMVSSLAGGGIRY